MNIFTIRTVDVSSIKELTRRWFPKAYFNAPAKTGNHRALGDIQDSIAELAYYRQAVFISASDSGTDSDENTAVKQGPTTP
jgi:oligoribonuclease